MCYTITEELFVKVIFILHWKYFRLFINYIYKWKYTLEVYVILLMTHQGLRDSFREISFQQWTVQVITLATITSIDRTFTFCELFSRTGETKNRANIFLKEKFLDRRVAGLPRIFEGWNRWRQGLQWEWEKGSEINGAGFFRFLFSSVHLDSHRSYLHTRCIFLFPLLLILGGQRRAPLYVYFHKFVCVFFLLFTEGKRTEAICGHDIYRNSPRGLERI